MSEMDNAVTNVFLYRYFWLSFLPHNAIPHYLHYSVQLGEQFVNFRMLRCVFHRSMYCIITVCSVLTKWEPGFLDWCSKLNRSVDDTANITDAHQIPSEPWRITDFLVKLTSGSLGLSTRSLLVCLLFCCSTPSTLMTAPLKTPALKILRFTNDLRAFGHLWKGNESAYRQVVYQLMS